MSDYIDRKALQKELNDWYDYHYSTASGETDRLHMDINKIVRNAPSVDAVEVVRCKDCKYYLGGVCDGICERLYYKHPKFGVQVHCVDEYDYCKWGEKE